MERELQEEDDPTSEFSNVEILNGLLAELNIDQTHILGFSIGGRIAIDFVLEHPRQVTSLILVAPGLSGYLFSQEHVQRISETLVLGAQKGALQAAEKWMEDPYLLPGMENPACRERVRQLVFDNADSLVRPNLEQYPRVPATTRLSEVEVPTLIIVGDRDVKDTYAIVDLIDSGIASSHKEVISGSGHIVNMENKNSIGLC